MNAAPVKMNPFLQVSATNALIAPHGNQLPSLAPSLATTLTAIKQCFQEPQQSYHFHHNSTDHRVDALTTRHHSS